ncbi:hypothetical protein RhiirC2_796096 [Rhizophagus irregularis]|uniref:Uncharacterized protein n=1 Tax=Rhizophagus irregularis TaxID=588596 RepID=A0A2N1MA97_9GLOM|nr:hypothetical protein RhiirC2_796096 [Rhizophagus irregularis]
MSDRKPKKMIRLTKQFWRKWNIDKICPKRNKLTTVERKAEGEHEGRLIEKESNINPSSSKANQADDIEGGVDSDAWRKEPSVYNVCTEEGKDGTRVLSFASFVDVEEEKLLEGANIKLSRYVRAKEVA